MRSRASSSTGVETVKEAPDHLNGPDHAASGLQRSNEEHCCALVEAIRAISAFHTYDTKTQPEIIPPVHGGPPFS